MQTVGSATPACCESPPRCDRVVYRAPSRGGTGRCRCAAVVSESYLEDDPPRVVNRCVRHRYRPRWGSVIPPTFSVRW